MSYLAFSFDQMSYSTICRIDELSYSTNCRIDEMVFNEMSWKLELYLFFDSIIIAIENPCQHDILRTFELGF